MAKNTVCHFEIPCHDAGKAAEFYENLFGWKMDRSMGDDYILFQPDGGVGGALSKTVDPPPSSGLVFYIEVDDIDAYLKKAVQLGGREARSRTEIPYHGWYGHFIDPYGNKMGLFTPKPKA